MLIAVFYRDPSHAPVHGGIVIAWCKHFQNDGAAVRGCHFAHSSAACMPAIICMDSAGWRYAHNRYILYEQAVVYNIIKICYKMRRLHTRMVRAVSPLRIVAENANTKIMEQCIYV